MKPVTENKRLNQLLLKFADEKAMEPIKKNVQRALAEKRRLYDELERRKLLKLA